MMIGRCDANCTKPSPSADVAGVGPVPVQMRQGWAQSRHSCGQGRCGQTGACLAVLHQVHRVRRQLDAVDHLPIASAHSRAADSHERRAAAGGGVCDARTGAHADWSHESLCGKLALTTASISRAARSRSRHRTCIPRTVKQQKSYPYPIKSYP